MRSRRSPSILPENYSKTSTLLVKRARNSRADGIPCRPIEACVIMLPLFEFMSGSRTFRRVFAGTLAAAEEEKKTATRITPLPLTLLSLSSYLLSHASSSSSTRAIAYANLALNTLLVMTENDEVMSALREQSKEEIRLCRQVSLPLCAPVSSWANIALATTSFTIGPTTTTASVCFTGLLYSMASTQPTQET